MLETLYDCYYMNHIVGKLEKVTVNSISSVADGFWINEYGHRTVGSDCKYWIPPNRIRYVEKI